MQRADAPLLIFGRWWSAQEINAIRQLIATHPQWSRRKISIVLSEELQWHTASGQLRDMAMRLVLHRLAQRQLIELPPRRPGGGRQRLRALQPEPELFGRAEPEPIHAALDSLRPLQFVLVQPRRSEAADFVRHLAAHHYLGFGGQAGQNLRYLVRDRQGRDLACALFAAAAWKLKARDAFIGWSSSEREQRLALVVNNSRFLILPHVRVPHLASHLLGRLLRRLAEDWQQKYALTPVLAETFVEAQRFGATCYRAANWRHVGQSSGRTRADRDHCRQVPRKEIYLFPLCRDFRQRLCG